MLYQSRPRRSSLCHDFFLDLQVEKRVFLMRLLSAVILVNNLENGRVTIPYYTYHGIQQTPLHLSRGGGDTVG